MRIAWGIEEKISLRHFGDESRLFLFELPLESFDLQPIQLLGSHIEKVEQFFYIDNPIDALIINDDFMNALTHLLSSPATNPQMSQALASLAFIGIDQAIDDERQNHMSPNGRASLLRILQ